MKKSLKWMKQARRHDNQTQTQNPIYQPQQLSPSLKPNIDTSL